MIISSIQKRRNGVEIIFDDFSKIRIDYRVVVDNGLRKNDNISEEQKNKLLVQTEKLKLKDSAFRLLSMRRHSKFELSQKLIRKGFEKAEVHSMLDELSSKGYLNDIDFAHAYVEERLAKKKVGINKIRAELISKGLDKSIIVNILSMIDYSISEETALKLAEKKLLSLRRKENNKRKITQKVSAFLFTKGFEPEMIRKITGKLNLDINEYEDL